MRPSGLARRCLTRDRRRPHGDSSARSSPGFAGAVRPPAPGPTPGVRLARPWTQPAPRASHRAVGPGRGSRRSSRRRLAPPAAGRAAGRHPARPSATRATGRGQYPDRGAGAVNPTPEQILEDLRILARDGNFRLIRMYGAGEKTATTLQLIRKHDLDLKVMVGAWLAAEVSNPACPWHPEPYADEVLEANRPGQRGGSATGDRSGKRVSGDRRGGVGGQRGARFLDRSSRSAGNADRIRASGEGCGDPAGDRRGELRLVGGGGGAAGPRTGLRVGAPLSGLGGEGHR